MSITHLQEYRLDREYSKTIEDIDAELVRVKQWAIDHDYHSGTSVGLIIKHYRDELRKLRTTLQEQLEE